MREARSAFAHGGAVHSAKPHLGRKKKEKKKRKKE
jgi:hypothetical protein